MIGGWLIDLSLYIVYIFVVLCVFVFEEDQILINKKGKKNQVLLIINNECQDLSKLCSILFLSDCDFSLQFLGLL